MKEMLRCASTIRMEKHYFNIL